MKIIVNGTAHEVQSSTLAALLAELGYGDAKVATALNEGFVSTGARASTPITDGDRIEIVSPRQGG
ncbi:sulfur carrier protein ThiS [Donghicola tyrosinivorans]|uniref:Sulfur carrier protein n=1 Tax=Donghicola tyrosinivorans TaxID=1652492 RepID=A0A2T0WPU8_9RHOB|nr:sulfur carrier protein ThiS [Donghicola tyrosinivorans]PRY88716.1 sulfur carrier protein [Donghicola tyrosinivorans]